MYLYTVAKIGGIHSNVSMNVHVCSSVLTHFPVPLLLQRKEGLWDGPPFEVDGDTTEFSLGLFGQLNLLFYPLTINQSYSVDVSGTMSQPLFHCY